MDPNILMTLLKTWSVVAMTVFTAVVTASSILLRMVASYIKSMQDYIPSYQAPRGLIIFMALLSALGQNSSTASSIIAAHKQSS